MFTQNLRKSSHVLRISSDTFILIIVFMFSLYLSSGFSFREIKSSTLLLLIGLVILWFFISNSVSLYDEFRSRNFTIELLNAGKCVFSQAITIILLQYIFKELSLSKLFLLIYTILLFFILITVKYYSRILLHYLRKKGRNLRSILIIGAGEVGERFYSTINENPHFGYHLIGFLDDNKKQMANASYLGKIDDLPDILSKNVVDDVIIALPTYALERIERVINTCDNFPTRVKIIPDYFRFITSSKFSVSMFGKFPIISVRTDRINELHWRILKRLFDLVLVVLITVFILSWLCLLISILLKLTSSGPVLFRQERWGRSNKRFLVYKFRTMYESSKDIDENGRYNFTVKDDPRITCIGRFLRKTNLDELPQFLNIFRDDMSLVGPRPHPTPMNLQAKDDISQYMLRHLVKPGITGWAQINGFRGDATKNSILQSRINYDIWYIENWSFQLDFQIILITIWKMLIGDPHAY